jgi:uncharacterized membrane protein YtjA (UPF0391 family)
MTLLKWALIFFLVSVVAGILGFTGISAASADVARFLFYVFVVIFLVLLILGLRDTPGGSGWAGRLSTILNGPHGRDRRA